MQAAKFIIKFFITVSVFSLVISGCGMQGDLYLPEDKQQNKTVDK